MGRKQWSVSTIMSILQNEKYKGDALLQKTYTADFLTKSIKKNNGEVPQYYIQNSHPAIIDPETFELVQQEIERRRPNRRQLHRSSPFAAKIVCGDCGGFYGRKVWHSTDCHRKQIWQCNHKYAEQRKCTTPNLTEDVIKAAFIEAFSQILRSKEGYISRLEKLLPLLNDTSKLERQLEDARTEHAGLMASLRRYMEENTRQIQDQAEYNRRFAEMDARCQAAEARIASLQNEALAQQGKKAQISRSIEELRRCRDPITEFDETLWNAMVESATVSAGSAMIFIFRDGTKIPVRLPDKT